ncbi:MAG: thermonuclease family protein [Oligoflexales bacterium]
MRLPSKIFAFFFAFISTVFAQTPDCLHDAHNFRCVKYLKNYDADTITFNIPDVHPLVGERISIRVKGIDTPEIRTKDQCEKDLAFKGRLFVKGMMESAERIDLLNIKRGKYFRIVADVIADGKSVAEEIRKNKLGYFYNGGTKKKVNWCEFGKN